MVVTKRVAEVPLKFHGPEQNCSILTEFLVFGSENVCISGSIQANLLSVPKPLY